MEPSTRFRLESAVFFAAALGFCAAATQQGWFRVFDLAAYDAVINRFQAPLSEDLMIVGIDEQSLAEHGAWPWPRSTQAWLLERIGEGHPTAVLIDIVYGGRTDTADDRALAEAGARLPTLALPVIIDALATRRQLVEVLPYPELLDAADVLGHAHVELDSDAIARGVYLKQGIGGAHWPHVAQALAQALGYAAQRASQCPDRNDFSLQNELCDFVYLMFAGPPGTIPEISAADLMNGRIDPGVLADKIVFLGITTSAAPDSITSPVSGHGRPMAGVEFNGNLFNAIVQNRLIEPASSLTTLLAALACVVLPVLLLPRLSPKAMLAAALSFACVPLLIGIVTLAAFRVELPLAAAVCSCLLCYPYWSWRRHEIAWSFVANEMSRLALERSRWVHHEQNTAESAGRALGVLLNAEPVWYEAAPSIPNERQIVLPGANNRWLVLTGQKPFSEADRKFGDSIGNLLNPPQPDVSLPGERLAAQIRILQRTAQEVRLGREVGLRGLEEMPIGVAVLSAFNQVLLVNRAWRALAPSLQPAETLDLNGLVTGVVPPLGRSWLEISRLVLIGKETISFETQTESGTPVVIEAAPLAQSGESAQPWVITLTDVTDVRVAERDREEALAFLSHDLRSPMLSVLALVRSAPTEPLLEDIGRYAQRALSVSDQFLQLSRVQAREQFETYEVDLVTILENAVDHVFHLAREKSIEIDVRYDLAGDEEAAWITGNGEMLERAFVNLLNNAVKYSGQGSRIELRLRNEAERFVAEVIDEGIGIPADELDQIFDPYFRSNEPRLAAQRGTGLGLRFVKTVFERHGGGISVSSDLDEGSRFTVTLPATQLDQ